MTDRWKLVRRADGAEQLYDLVADPGERDDVNEGNDRVVADLRRTLDDALSRRAVAPSDQPAHGDAALPDEQIEALRSLGYVDD